MTVKNVLTHETGLAWDEGSQVGGDCLANVRAGAVAGNAEGPVSPSLKEAMLRRGYVPPRVNVAYADSHVVFIPNAGDKVGTNNGGLNNANPIRKLQYMDSGEE